MVTDDLSKTGASRPTTRTLTIFCSEPEDGQYFRDKVGAANVDVKSSRLVRTFNNLVIVDTPDTNSTVASEHEHLVAAAISAADVLICAFPAENALDWDQIAYLIPWVRRFTHEALYAVVTMSEKFPAEDMKKDVLEPLSDTLTSNWGRAPHKTFAVSARSHLQEPCWGEGEKPIFGCLDEFELLREELSEKFNRDGAQAGMRADRAEHWLAKTQTLVSLQAEAHQESAREALDGINALSTSVRNEANRRMSREVTAARFELIAAQAMWGPISWCLMLWALVMYLVSAAGATVNALRQLPSYLPFFLSWNRKTIGKDVSDEEKIYMTTDEVARLAGELSVNAWPNIAADIREAGFHQQCQENPLYPPERGDNFCRELASTLSDRWIGAVYKCATDSFGGFWASLLLNLLFLFPTFVVLQAAARNYLTGRAIAVGFGAGGIVFIAMWWLCVLSGMHGLVHWRKARLYRTVLEMKKLGDDQPVNLARETTEELLRVIDLASLPRICADK